MNVYVLFNCNSTGEGCFSDVVATFLDVKNISDYVKKNFPNYKEDEHNNLEEVRLRWFEVSKYGKVLDDSFLDVEEFPIEDF